MAFVLIGFMGAGKSTVGRELAAALATDPLDSDELLSERFGRPVGQAFEELGEDAFRAREEELVLELLDGAGPERVVALGGGSVTSERVRERLGEHFVVLLDVSTDTAWERVQGGAAEHRPLAHDREAFAALHAARRDTYEELADAILPELELGGATAALAAVRVLPDAPAGTRLLWARAAGGDYPVWVGRGLLAGEHGVPEPLWPLDRERSRPFLVSDTKVLALYGAHVGAPAATATFPPGEPSKTLATAEHVWQELVDRGMTRADHVVALGGGVVGDVAGFCAATYQRGVPVVHLPTTLVAQVDSAFGGKTGVDLPQAKNYVGAYHQPAAVIVDPDVLASLPAGELAAGWVEVLKTALIAGGSLWEAVARGGEVDERQIVACIRTKLAVVAQDERDSGDRQLLNLGHTVGHAIEAVTGYARYRHGEAVGLGLLAALRLSGQDALREQVRELLTGHALPVTLDGVDPDAVLAATARDKKRVGDRVPFVLVNAPGDVRTGGDPPAEDVRAAIAELAA